MTSNVVLPFILLMMFIVKAEGGLEFLQHTATKRFLASLGTGFANIRSRSGHGGFPRFDLRAIFLYVQDLGYNEQKFIFTDYDNQGDETRIPKVMDITNGCHQNSTVRQWDINGTPAQRWYFNADGSITSLCNPDWRLIIDNYGGQYVRDVKQIPKEEQIFRSVPVNEIGGEK